MEGLLLSKHDLFKQLCLQKHHYPACLNRRKVRQGMKHNASFKFFLPTVSSHGPDSQLNTKIVRLNMDMQTSNEKFLFCFPFTQENSPTSN